MIALSEESVAQKSAAAPITTKTPIKVGIPDSSQNINNTSKQLKGLRIKLFNSPSDETALTTRSTTRAKETILPTSFDSPKPVKQKLPRASELDLLKFKTWYTPDYCEALIFSAYSRNILLPLAFSDTLNNREAFIWQVENAKLLCALVAKPLLFICKEPGSHNHFIAGILMNDKLLLLNPLGKTKYKDTRDILNEMVQKNILSSYKESANVLQQAHYEKTGLVSCDPLTVELIKNLLRNLTLNDLQKLFSDNAQEVDMGNWLAGQLTTNPFRTETSYKTYLLNIRQEHHQLYKNISDSAEVLNPPQQIIFNLLVTREETLISISNHPVNQQHVSKKTSLDNKSAGIKLTTASQNPTVKERDRFFSHKPVIENDQRFKKGASQKILYIAESYGYISDEVLSAYGFKPEQYRRAKKDIEHIVYIYANPEDAASDFNVEPNHNNPFEYVD